MLMQRKTYDVSQNNTKCSSSSETGNQTMQFIVGISASLSTAIAAANYSWVSPALPYLKSNQSKFPVTDEQGAWIISIMDLGDIVGGLLIIFLIDRIGRKLSLLVNGLPSLFSWIIIIFADNYTYILIARFVAGIGQGFIYGAIIVYLSEISEHNVRGTLISMSRISAVIAMFLLTAVGSFLSYETLTMSCTIAPLLFIVTFVFMPESPYYLLMKGRDEDAMKCLMKLRNLTNPEILIPVIREMKLDIEQNLKQNAFKELVMRSYNRKALLIVICLKVTQFASGQGVIITYAEEIFTMSGSSLTPKVSVLILAGFRLISSIISGGVMDRMSKRINFLSCGIIGAILLSTLSLFFFLKLYIQADVSMIKWLPLTVIILFELVFHIGINVVPYAIQGEIFPVNVRGAAIACGMNFGSILSLTMLSSYYAISNAAGIYTALWIFALIAIVGSIISFFIIPETNGKTLEEIQAMQNPEMKFKLDLERSSRAAVENNS